MKSRAALLLLATASFVVVQSLPEATTLKEETSTVASERKPTIRNVTESKITKESIIKEASIVDDSPPKSSEFGQPFTNPKDILLQEIRSLDEDASTTKQIQEELAKAIKAEAQKNRDGKPRVPTTQKSRSRIISPVSNALYDDIKNPLVKKLTEDEALKALKQAETGLAYDEELDGNVDDVDDDDDDDDDDVNDDDDDDDYDDDTDEDDDDVADEEEVMTECPNYCRCSGQYAAATTARCSKLIDDQNFGPGIAHLRIENAGELNLDAWAIQARGLQQLESITIVDTKIINFDSTAFNGTKYLFAVNLTRNGLRELKSDYFVNNTQLSLVTISGQSFDNNWYETRDYILNSSSIAEFDFSDNSIVRLPRNAFSKMSNLAFVDLKNNKIRHIEKTTFENMDALVELDLSGNLLNDIPEGIFLGKGLQTLRIMSNNLTELGIQEASKLTYLDVSNNHIKYITKDDLLGVTALEKFIISSNGLRRIHQHSFSDLDQLTYLDISNNKLTSLNEHHLRSNPRLQVVIMSENPGLAKLPVFKTIGYEDKTYSVYRLECANCGLDTIDEGTFDAMPALTKLILSKNRLARFPIGLLEPLSALRDLDLSDNMINAIDSKMFTGARSLTKLNLAGNPLVTLQVTPFLETTSLSRLDVSRCQLRRVWSEARQPLKSLRFLSVRGNELKRITLEELKATPKLSGLDASHNPFACDEEFSQAIQWLIDHGVTPTEVLKYISNYGSAAEDYAETEGISQWSDLARIVCDNGDDGPPSRNIPRKPIVPQSHIPTFALPKDDDNLLSTGIDGLSDLEFIHGQRMGGKLEDDNWSSDEYQEYDEENSSNNPPILTWEVERSWFTQYLWPILIISFFVLPTLCLIISFARGMAKSRGRGPVLRPPMMLRQGLVDNKNCGLVYKPLQEEIATPHMPKRGSFYSSSTFHYDKIVPESV